MGATLLDEERPAGTTPSGALGAPGWWATIASGDGWGLSPRTVVAIVMLPAAIVLAGAGSALLGKATFKALTGEDGLAEIAQVLLYALAAVLTLVLIATLRRRDERRVAALYTLLFLALVFVVGEEISWGQRIVGWSTPDALAAVNKQDETNIHNLEAVATTFKWAQLIVGAYGGLVPVVVHWWRRRQPERPMPEIVEWIVPPLSLAPYFLGLAAWRIYRTLTEAPRGFEFVVSEFNEVFELVLACGFALMCLYQLRRARRLPGA